MIALSRWWPFWLFALTASTSAVSPSPAKSDQLAEVTAKFLNHALIEQQARKLRQAPSTLDVGDGYLGANLETIPLLRVVDEVAVVASADADLALTFATAKPRLGIDDASPTRTALLGKGRQLSLIKSATAGQAPDVAAIAGLDPTLKIFPVLWDPATQSRMVLSDELIVRPRDGAFPALQAWAAREGWDAPEPVGPSRLQCFVLRQRATGVDALTAALRLAADPMVAWATPNFVRELSFNFVPNDPLFPWQQSLHNTGQQGGVADADVDAPEAWDLAPDANSVVIGVIDTGVDTTHPDLQFFVNPGESGSGKETNGIDDDGNGLIDDWRGWDFYANDNNPNPTVAGVGGHGTACAGIAAARINNSTRVAGMAPNARILPIKISADATDSSFATDAQLGSAISYAAEYADILSNSWGGGSSSSFISAAIHDAVTQGRQGKGCAVFFASGNGASIWAEGRFSIGALFGAGTYSFGFRYVKDNDDTLGPGEDLVKIDNVVVSGSDGYTHQTTPIGPSGRQDFEGTFPPAGWTLSSSAGIVWTNTLANAFQGTAGSRSAQSGHITHNQWTELRTPNVSIGSLDQLRFYVYRSSEFASQTGTVFDGLDVRVYNAGGSLLGTFGRYGGIFSTANFVNYPASHPDAIAVGAATDSDRRSDYSQYGAELDLVAPSNGGWNAITTLDPSGTVGYSTSDYSTTFGGTSAATPLAAGIGALLLAADPTLTATQIRNALQTTADKIGTTPYTSGFNTQYGFGRVNARAALESVVTPNQDDTPFVSVAVADNTASEPGPNTAAFSVFRVGSTLAPVSVNFVLSGTASNGVDFSFVPASVIIPAGATSAPVVISPIDNSEPEDPKSVILSLATGSGYLTNGVVSAELALFDNDVVSACPPGVLALDGIDDFASVGASLWPTNIFPASFTVEAWIYPRSLSGLRFVAADDAFDFTFGSSALNHVLYGPSGLFSSASLASAPIANSWNHVAITFDGNSRQLRAALNGVLSSPVSFPESGFYSDNAQHLTLGARRLSPKASPEGFFHGEIDEVRFSSSVRYTANFKPQVRFNADASTRALYHFDESAGATSFADTSGASRTLFGFSGAQAAALPSPGSENTAPVAHWRFDENAGATAADASGNGNEGLLINGPSWDPNGQAGGCLSFDGLNDLLTVSNSPALELGKNNTDFSVAFWVNLQQGFNGSWRTLMHKGEGTNRTFALYLHPNANRIHYRISTLANWNEGSDSVGVLSTNTWTHVALIKSGSAYRLYLNGVLDSQRILPSPVVHNSLPFYVGSHPSTPPTKAKFDDLRLYCRALSDLELYDVRALVAHWRFAEGSGAVAQDASPYNNDAFLGPVSTAPSWTANGSDAALSFDGVDDILTVPDAPSIQLGKNNADFSVTFWLKLLENFNGNWRALMQKGEGTNRTFSLFLHPNANRIHYRISTLANWNEGFDSVGVLSTNTWTHVALLKSGSAYRLYFNGVLDSQRILPSPVVHNTFPLYIGDHPALPATKAILDDVRLYADDLPPAVLSSLIAQPLNQPIPSPFDTPVLLPADLASNASSASKSELALASVRPNDPASAVPPRLTLSLDTASGQLLLQQVLDPTTRPTDWTWELSDDLLHWSPAPPPALATSADGLPVLQLRLPQAANTTRFFRATSVPR